MKTSRTDLALCLVPRPQRIELGEHAFAWPRRLELESTGEPELALALAHFSERITEFAPMGAHERSAVLSVALDHSGAFTRSESYRLVIERSRIGLRARDGAGIAHGLATLEQLARACSFADDQRLELPCVAIDDWPDFAARGFSLDISRDKVPTMATLYTLVELLAHLKLNQLQLYTEHTFAYRGHEHVSRDASPLSGAEIEELDRFCRARHIELVPNQQSFGHLHRWLVHEPYRRLAEVPEGLEHAFSREREPFGLCPVDPGSLALLDDLYD